MRHAIVAIVTLISLAACSNNEEQIARKKLEYKDLQVKYKALNAEYSAKHPERQKVLDAVIPANLALTSAKRGADEADIATAQLAFDEAQADANDVITAETDLKRRIRALKDQLADVEKVIRNLGGKP